MRVARRARIRDIWSSNELVNCPQIAQLMIEKDYYRVERYLTFNEEALLNKDYQQECLEREMLQKGAPKKQNLAKPYNSESSEENDGIKVQRVKVSLALKHLTWVLNDIAKACINFALQLQIIGICLDETLIAFRGRSFLIYYEPNKPHKYGMLITVLCDCVRGFCLNFILRENGVNGAPPINMVQHVNEIVGPLRQAKKRFVLYADRGYGSLELVPDTIKNDDALICTIDQHRLQPARANWGKDPIIANNKARLYEGEWEGSPVFHLHYTDKGDCHILSTICPDNFMTMTGSHRKRNKPTLVAPYNEHKGSVDAFNHCLKQISFPHYTKMWNHETYRAGVDICLLNGHKYYKIRIISTLRTVQEIEYKTLQQRLLIKYMVAGKEYNMLQAKQSFLYHQEATTKNVSQISNTQITDLRNSALLVRRWVSQSVPIQGVLVDWFSAKNTINCMFRDSWIRDSR